MSETEKVDSVEAIVNVVRCVEGVSSNKSKYMRVTCEDGKEAICWYPYLFKVLMQASQDKSCLCVTIERRGEYNHLVAIEGVEKPPAGNGHTAEAPTATTPTPTPPGGKTQMPQPGGPQAPLPASGSVNLVVPEQVFKILNGDDEPTRRGKVLHSIGLLIHAGAIKPEFFHSALSSGEEYVDKGKRFMLVDGKPTAESNESELS